MWKSKSAPLLFVFALFAIPNLAEAFPLSGTLRGAAGQPIAGGRAILEKLPTRYEETLDRLGLFSPEEGSTRSAITDPHGDFRFETGEVGVYRLRLEADGFDPAEDLPLVMIGGEKQLAPTTLTPFGGDTDKATPGSRPHRRGLGGGLARPTLEIRGPDEFPVEGVLITASETGSPMGLTDSAGRLTFPEPVTFPVDLRFLTSSGHRQEARLTSGRGVSVFTLDPSALTPEPSVIHGTVANEHGRPMQGALVWPGWDAGRFTITDANGRFVLPPAPAGRFWIQAEAKGFYPRSIEVTPGLIHLRLSPEAVVRGRVADAEGRALAGAQLVAIPLGRPPRAFFGRHRGQVYARSDATGNYTLWGLSSETLYSVRADQHGFVAASRPTGNLASRERDDLDLILTASRPAFGRVLAITSETDEEAKALPGAIVQIRATLVSGLPETVPVTVTSDPEGFFHLAELPGFDLDLEFRAPGFAPMNLRGLPVEPADGEARNQAADLGTVVLVPAAKIHGVVKDAEGTAIPGVSVYLTRELEIDPARRVSRLKDEPATQTGVDGSFVLDGLTPGERLHLMFSVAGFLPEIRQMIEAPSREDLMVVLTPAARIAGRVLDESEAPVADAVLTLAPIYPDLGPGIMGARLGPEHRHTTRTDIDGAFVFETVTTASYELTTHARGFSSPSPRQLEVSLPGEKDLEIVLAVGATVEGRITRPGGEPVADARVYGGDQGTRSADDGTYRLTGLPVGQRLAVSVRHAESAQVTRTIELAVGELMKLDLVVADGRSVSGQVKDDEGSGVADVHIVLDSKGRRDAHRYETMSGADGSFQFDEVANGVYALEATRSGYGTVSVKEWARVEGAALDGLEVVLPLAATVRGEVRGVEFDVLSTLRVEAVLGTGQSKPGTVYALGQYEVTDLGPGDWALQASVPGGTRQARARVAIAPGKRDFERDLNFNTGITFKGQVLLEGEPLAGARVQVRGHNVAIKRGLIADYEGRYRFEGLPAGYYRVSASKGLRMVRHNRDLHIESDTDLLIEIDATEISGQVVDADSGQPLDGAWVTAQQLLSSGEENVSRARRKSSMYSLPSAPDGAFRIAGLTASFYHLTVEIDGYAPYEQEIDLTDGADTDSLEIALEPTPAVELQVETADGGPPPPWVRAYLGDEAGEAVMIETHRVDASGQVRLVRIPEGHKRLFLSAPGSEMKQIDLEIPGPHSVIFRPAGRLRLRVPALVETHSVASARLINAEGQPLRGGKATTSWQLMAGNGVIEGVPEGSWKVRIVAPDGQRWESEVEAPGSGEIFVEVN